MYCIHYLWFNNLPGKLVMCHSQFWQFTNQITLFLKKKKKKKKPWCNQISIKELWNLTIKQDDIPLTNQVWVLFCISNRSSFLLGFLAQVQSVEEKEKGCETYNMDQENEVSKIFSVSLGSNKGRREGEIKFKKHFLCCTVKYNLLNQSIIVHVLSERYNKLRYSHV